MYLKIWKGFWQRSLKEFNSPLKIRGVRGVMQMERARAVGDLAIPFHTSPTDDARR